MALISSADYPAVRAAIDITLTQKQLPDAIISLPIFQGMAEAEVLRVYPAAQTATDPTIVATVKNATVLITAALLVPSVPMLTRETFGNYQYQRARVDLATLAATIRARADDMLGILVDPTGDTLNMPTMFTKASASEPTTCGVW